MSRKGAVVGVVVAALAVSSSPAAARVVEKENYSGTEEFTDSPCGSALEFSDSFRGSFRLRAVQGGEAFLGKDTYHFRTVVTNPATGKWFVIRGHGVFNEIKATLVEGTIYKFVAVEAGQPFVIEDADGNVIVRDRGSIRHSALFDTLGDGQPGADLIMEFEPIVHGPHPGFAEDFPFCDIVEELTGP